jgi:aldehyde:ferredoxin oxidoreductase
MIEKPHSAYGYMGNVLYVDLTAWRFWEDRLNLEYADLLLGGRGFGVAYLFEHFNGLRDKYGNPFREVDPLGEDNVIVLATSATTATRVPTSGRLHMSFKSPLTGALGSTNGGGHFSVALKRAGYDLLVITGRSKTPCILVVSNGKVAFKDAADITELNTVLLRSKIRKEFSKKTQVLTIGLGGQKKCRFASVMTDSGKALGRGGGGAVFGSKMLYAVAVMSDPDLKVKVRRPEDFKLKNKDGVAHKTKLKLDVGKLTKKEEFFGILPSLGSLGVLGMINHFGQLIHNNMQDTTHRIEDINMISGEALRYHARDAGPKENRLKVEKSGCFNCPILCKRDVTIVDYKGKLIEKGAGPEFETTTLLGANLSIYNLELIVKANFLANEFGLDTISLGSTIASFFNLFDVIKNKQTSLASQEKMFLEDIKELVSEFGEPCFGNENLLLPIINLIGRQAGIGIHLAQGSSRFCSRYGHAELSMSVKKLELPAYDPRGSFSQALCYEMNNRGGCHLEGGYTAPQSHCAGYGEWPSDRIEGTPLICRNATLKNTSLDVMGLCAYGGFSLGLDEYAALVSSVTGKEYNSGILETIAERVITLERQFNLLCGLTKDDDLLPERFFSESITAEGKEKILDRENFSSMRKEYYRLFGWDENGVPSQEILRKLSIQLIVDIHNQGR